MIMNGKLQPRQFTIAGIALPYLVIVIFAGIIMTMPGTADDKTNNIAWISFVVPFIAAIIGALLVGVGSLQKEKLEKKRKSLIHAFLFGAIWTAIFHFFITLYWFLMIIYSYAGLKLL
jgi:hypothetical protein